MEYVEMSDTIPEKAWGSLKKKLNRSIVMDNGVPVTPLAFKKLKQPDSLTSESESESSSKDSSVKIKTQVHM